MASSGFPTYCYDVAAHAYDALGDLHIPGVRPARARRAQPCGGNASFSGKERDAETNLDYFGARYMSAAQGRFTSPDPIFIAQHKMFDPQQWNLYSYAANNPLMFVDPSGMAVKLACQGDQGEQNCQEVVTDLNNRKDAAFQTTLGSNGNLQVVDANNVDPTTLSKSEAALFNSIQDADHTATLTVVSQSDSVQFGRFNGAGSNTLDAADLRLMAGGKGDVLVCPKANGTP